MTFVKGQSGNPAGRPPGARNRATLIAEGLFEQEGEALARKAIERALDGARAPAGCRSAKPGAMPPRLGRPGLADSYAETERASASWPCSPRPSTSWPRRKKDVDARDKPAHDAVIQQGRDVVSP
jgi:hypothetical protein